MLLLLIVLNHFVWSHHWRDLLKQQEKFVLQQIIYFGIMLLHKSTQMHSKNFWNFVENPSPTCLNSDSSELSCHCLFLSGILYSFPVAAIYALKDNFSVNESVLQESPGAEISVARTSFSQQPAKTIHCRLFLLKEFYHFCSWIIHEQMLIFTSSVVIWNCLNTLYKHIATSGLFVLFFFFWFCFITMFNYSLWDRLSHHTNKSLPM